MFTPHRHWKIQLAAVAVALCGRVAVAGEKAAADAAAEAREAYAARFAAANAAWAKKDFAAVRTECGKVLNAADAPAHFRSYAHLRLAQSFLAQGNPAAATAEYEKIKADAAYPYVHRYEAEECLKEIARAAQGQPARDPLASRTKVPPVKPAKEFFVAPDGDDAHPGTAEKPVATWAKARDLVRALKQAGGLPAGGVAVTFKPGVYNVQNTTALTAEDGGTAEAPIVYRAEAKGTAMFYGGAWVSGFEPVTDPAILARLPEEARGRVQQADLKAQGLTDYGQLAVRGFSQPPSPPTLELYCNEQPMTVARWPNQGFVAIKSLVAAGSRPQKEPSVIEYLDPRPERWTQAKDLWLFGYFRWLWADATIRIAKVDPAAHTLTSDQSYQYGNNADLTMENKQGIVYYAFNLLEEIDQPGEWYLDREAGKLYFWPPVDPAGAMIEIGRFSEPMLTLDKVSNVRLEGLGFDLGRYNCMQLKDCDHCLISAVTVKRFAGNGITINGGTDNGILGCDLGLIGRRATEVIGGDRATLTPGRHFVENCQIHAFGRIDRTYTPAVQLEGVGNRVAHNLMYDCPSSVMRIEGNDHLMEYNEVHSAVQESDDQGAMELYRNATYRGVIFRYNYYHHNGKTGSESAVCGRAGIRFDDAISGMLVYGNIFFRSANGHFGGVQMNSGRDNVIDNNLFIDCKQGISGGWNAGNSVWKLLREGKWPGDFYKNELYLSRYPLIATMLEEPAVNYIWRNVFYKCGRDCRSRNRLDLLANAVYLEEDPGFVDAARADFRLRPDAPLFGQLGFRPIPVEEIGLYEDEYRASWPVTSTPVEVPDWRNDSAEVKARPHNLPPVAVKKAAAPIIDGQISAGEWPDAPLILKETPQREPIKGPAASAWLAHDGARLYVAVQVPVTGKINPGANWGDSDGAEVCLRPEDNLAVGKRAPTFVLQGFTGGELQGTGNPDEDFSKETRALGQATKYAAKVEKDKWTGEWSIPLAALGVAYAPQVRLQFNLGVRRPSTGEWVVFAGAMGANFQLDNAAVIRLE